MGKIIDLEFRRGPKTIDNVLELSAVASTAIYRLRAEAKEKYGVGTPGYKFVIEQITKLENYHNDSTQVLMDLQESLANSTQNGVRTVKHIKSLFFKLWDHLFQVGEIEVPANVLFIEDYRAGKRLRNQQSTDEPKGAA